MSRNPCSTTPGSLRVAPLTSTMWDHYKTHWVKIKIISPFPCPWGRLLWHLVAGFVKRCTSSFQDRICMQDYICVALTLTFYGHRLISLVKKKPKWGEKHLWMDREEYKEFNKVKIWNRNIWLKLFVWKHILEAYLNLMDNIIYKINWLLSWNISLRIVCDLIYIYILFWSFSFIYLLLCFPNHIKNRILVILGNDTINYKKI